MCQRRDASHQWRPSRASVAEAASACLGRTHARLCFDQSSVQQRSRQLALTNPQQPEPKPTVLLKGQSPGRARPRRDGRVPFVASCLRERGLCKVALSTPTAQPPPCALDSLGSPLLRAPPAPRPSADEAAIRRAHAACHSCIAPAPARESPPRHCRRAPPSKRTVRFPDGCLGGGDRPVANTALWRHSLRHSAPSSMRTASSPPFGAHACALARTHSHISACAHARARTHTHARTRTHTHTHPTHTHTH